VTENSEENITVDVIDLQLYSFIGMALFLMLIEIIILILDQNG
jgi:hypothetical protein